MLKIVGAFLGCERIEALTDRIPEGIDSSFGGLSEHCLELCEGHFDGVEVGRIGWQEEEPRATPLNDLSNPIALVGAQIVEDDDVAGRKRWGEYALDINLKDHPVHGSVDHEWRRDRVVAQSGDEGGGLPMAVGDGANQALTPHAAALPAHHVGFCPGLVDEDQRGWIKRGLMAPPSQARGGHVRPVLLGGVHGFF